MKKIAFLVLYICSNYIALSQRKNEHITTFPILFIDSTQKFPPNATTNRAKTFQCKDTIFRPKDCQCVGIRAYNDSNKITRYVMGDDIERNKIDFIAQYPSVTDTICTVLTDYFPEYLDANGYFQLDTTIKGKYKKWPIYEREKNNHMLIRSVAYFKRGHESADSILNFDKHNKLREKDYPLGSVQPKQWADTVIASDEFTITNYFKYSTHLYQTIGRFSKKGNQLDRQEFHKDNNDSVTNYERYIFIYDDSSRLITSHRLFKNNVLFETKKYQYQNGKLLTIESDAQIDKYLWRYNEDGLRTEYTHKHIDQTDTDIFTYQAGILRRRDHYRNGKLQDSHHYVFE